MMFPSVSTKMKTLCLTVLQQRFKPAGPASTYEKNVNTLRALLMPTIFNQSTASTLQTSLASNYEQDRCIQLSLLLRLQY